LWERLSRNRTPSPVERRDRERKGRASIAPGHQLDRPLVGKLLLDDHALADLHKRALKAPARRGVPDLHVGPFGEERMAFQQRERPPPKPIGIGRARVADLGVPQQRERRFGNRRQRFDIDLGRQDWYELYEASRGVI